MSKTGTDCEEARQLRQEARKKAHEEVEEEAQRDDEPAGASSQEAQLVEAIAQELRRRAERAQALAVGCAEPTGAKEEGQSIEARRRARGLRIDFYLHHGGKVASCMRETTTCIATNGTSTIFLYDDGLWDFTDDLPERLRGTLDTRRVGRHAPPTYVALGTMDRYYLSFGDGQEEWVGCDEMYRCLTTRPPGREVCSVAFGEHRDSFFLVFTDGSYQHALVPADLVQVLKSWDHACNLKYAALGPSGEWHIQATDGRSWSGGCTERFRAATFGKEVKFVDFGSEGAYLFRYD